MHCCVYIFTVFFLNAEVSLEIFFHNVLDIIQLLLWYEYTHRLHSMLFQMTLALYFSMIHSKTGD